MKQQITDKHVTSLAHIIPILRKQSLLFLLDVACLADKQQIPIS
jgi:hypothetical protein